MATGNLSILAANVRNFIPGVLAFAGQASGNFAVYKKIKDRQYNLGPQWIKDQYEQWEEAWWRRNFSQTKNMWVDKELQTEVSRKELADHVTFRMDLWRFFHCGFGPLFLLGGWTVPFWSLWLGNWKFLPSTFPQTPEQKAQWFEYQDITRYKYGYHLRTEQRWFMDFLHNMNDNWWPYWHQMWEKNDYKIENHKELGLQMRKYENFQPFWNIRRKQARAMCRAHVIPSFPGMSKMYMAGRLMHYWELIFNEDYMVITGKLHETMNDAELQDYAWRRFLSPYDKKLTREQILERVNQYHEFLGDKFVAEGDAPNLFMLTAYVFRYYDDPGFLEMDISELDKNDFDHLASWGKDAFLQRLELENGPLRDQIEAHSQKKIAERAKLLAENP